MTSETVDQRDCPIPSTLHRKVSLERYLHGANANAATKTHGVCYCKILLIRSLCVKCFINDEFTIIDYSFFII